MNPTKGREELVRSIKAFLEKKKENELQKKEEERQRKEELERQRKQQEEERKRLEKLSQIETEIAALEAQKTEREKIVLQKEQELKLAQVDLKACEAKIQKLQARLDEIRNLRTNEVSGKNIVIDSSMSESKPKRTAPQSSLYTGNNSSDYKVILKSVGPNSGEIKRCIQKGTRITSEQADYFVTKAPIDLFGSYSLAEANKIIDELVSLGATATIRKCNTRF